MATGIQEKFSWKAVGLAALSGGIGGGLAGKFGSGIGGAMMKGAATSAISQGIGVTLGLQDKFNWAAVAAAGVAAGFGAAAGQAMGNAGINVQAFSSRIGIGMASAIGDATAHTLIEGTDFGDNLRAALPSAIGSAIGGYITEGGGSGPGLLDYVTSQITYSPGNVANQTIAQILNDNPNMSTEQIDRLKEKGPEWKADIAVARKFAKAGDITAAGAIQRRIMDETLSFYPPETQEAAMALLDSPARRSGVVSAAGGADEVIVVNGIIQYGRAFGLLDRPGVLAGRLKNNVEGEIGAWLDKTPGARAALSVVETGMAIGGGPVRFAAAMAMGAANQQIVQKTTDRFEAAGYGPETARAGGEGLPWLAGIALGSVKLGGLRGGSAFKDFNQARNAALQWLEGRGFKAEQATLGRFGANTGRPIGMKSADGKSGFRVEFDERHGAHINVWSGKKKETFTFQGKQSTVDEIVKQFVKERP